MKTNYKEMLSKAGGFLANLSIAIIIAVMIVFIGLLITTNKGEIKSTKQLKPTRYELVVKEANKIDTIWVYSKEFIND